MDVENSWLPVGMVGRGGIGVGEWEVQTLGCKTGSRTYCTTWGIEAIFHNNCKWKVTFKKLYKNFFLILNTFCP